MILANPPFAGSLDYEGTAKDLLATVRTKKTELLFLALFLRLMKTGGRAAVIVPDGVLFGSTKAHKTLRKMLVEDHKLDGIVSLPSGVFKPYAGVSTAIVFFTKTGMGGTDNVWFYDLQNDGYSLDDRRNPIDTDDLPDALTRWADRDGSELDRERTDQSFCVPASEIADNDYDLSINRYKEIVYEEIDTPNRPDHRRARNPRNRDHPRPHRPQGHAQILESIGDVEWLRTRSLGPSRPLNHYGWIETDWSPANLRR